jgi:hypothetical protein
MHHVCRRTRDANRIYLKLAFVFEANNKYGSQKSTGELLRQAR